MKFYERILLDLRNEEHTFQTIYKHAFSFKENVYFEQSSNLRIERTTYAEVRQNVLKLAQGIKAYAGSERIVALIMSNSPLWVECFWAVLKAGYKALLLSPLMPEKTLAKCLYHTGCRVVLGNVQMDGYTTISCDRLLECISKENIVTEDNQTWGDEVILATSSTTGDPKLIAYDGKAICSQILNSASILKNCKKVARFDRGKIRMLAFLPFSHIFGLIACFLWFTMFGATFVFLNNIQPETIMRTCRLHRVTHVFAVPLLWDTMAKRIRQTVESKGISAKFDALMRLSLKLQDALPELGGNVASYIFSSVQKQTMGRTIKYCISGGGMLSKETMPLINAIGYPLENGYGMTEIGIASLSCRKASQCNGRIVGKPLPSLNFRLDEDGQLWVQGQSCYCARYIDGKRYLSRPDEFFATGDIFSIDEKGEYRFVSRKDDLVNGSNGERLSPDEIENQMGLPVEHCVFGTQDGNVGLMLYLPEQCYISVKRMKQEIDNVMEAIDRLPGYMRPRHLYVSKQPLPLSLSGKIKRKAIGQGVADHTYPCETLSAVRKMQTGQEDNADKMLLKTVMSIFAECAHTDMNVGEHSHFFADLGGDSLAFLEMISEIEKKFDVRITNDLSMEMTTPATTAVRISQLLETTQRGDSKQ